MKRFPRSLHVRPLDAKTRSVPNFYNLSSVHELISLSFSFLFRVILLENLSHRPLSQVFFLCKIFTIKLFLHVLTKINRRKQQIKFTNPLEWKNYAEPATGYGIHNYILHYNKPIRLTQAELEVNSEFKNFGRQSGKHPPMRGWLAAPLKDRNETNWGLVQLSDKLDGDYTEEEERLLCDFTRLISYSLELAWEKRRFQKQMQH